MCASEARTEDHENPIAQAELRRRLGRASVAILGCGGLGSNCAAMLLRTGVRTLTLIDFDVVEHENLNRQLYFADQIGEPKVQALAQTLHRIDPDATLRLVETCITRDNVIELVDGADVVVEAVDDAETKTFILRTCARELPTVPVVSASGLAGHGRANSIQTVQLGESLWVVGDLVSDIRDGHALLASRVMLAAAHQALAVTRILLGLPAE